jgi:hypothetical protein
MYSIDDLLRLAHIEKADELRLHVGKRPVMVWHDEHPFARDHDKHRYIEGPAITIEDSEHFLLSLANSRYRRDIREHGGATFFFLFQGKILFLVRANVENGVMGFEIQ